MADLNISQSLAKGLESEDQIICIRIISFTKEIGLYINK